MIQLHLLIDVQHHDQPQPLKHGGILNLKYQIVNHQQLEMLLKSASVFPAQSCNSTKLQELYS